VNNSDFLLWLRDRFTLIYGEDPSQEFIKRLEELADMLKPIEPKWMAWINHAKGGVNK
jgi:hypothetical protein